MNKLIYVNPMRMRYLILLASVHAPRPSDAEKVSKVGCKRATHPLVGIFDIKGE